MGDEASASREPPRIAEAQRALDARGRDVGFAGARIAFGRSGIAIGFPRDPLVHVSWWVLAALAALVYALRRRSRRS